MYKLKQLIKKVVTKLNNIFYTKYVKRAYQQNESANQRIMLTRNYFLYFEN